ncbi:MAG: tRNA epoxyqueuosine(34) reductase QueG [Bacillota bacterium]
MNLTQKIKKQASSIGFDLIGITDGKPLERAYKRLQERKQQNKISSFVTRDIKQLTHPHLHLPSVKSIIALGMSYANSESYTDEDMYIADYARGKDYHLIFQERMELLEKYIKKQVPDVKMIAYADTGPLLDREIAWKAGLGWFGKNNNIINSRYGSYLLLGEILTDLQLEYDSPIKEQCGICEKCLLSCPGEALVESRKLDPDKCISYLTQKKGILSETEREKIGKNLWGCDICQKVCPYNQKILKDLNPELKPVLKGNINKVLNFTKNNFPESWKNSALSWRGLRILKRNTLINIANQKRTDLVDDIKPFLYDPSPIIRGYTVWVIGKLAPEEAVKLLSEVKQKEKDKLVIQEILNVLNNSNQKDSIWKK